MQPKSVQTLAYLEQWVVVFVLRFHTFKVMELYVTATSVCPDCSAARLVRSQHDFCTPCAVATWQHQCSVAKGHPRMNIATLP